MKRRHSFLVAAALVALVACSGVANATLYGVSTATSSLYTIDPGTGAATLVAPISPGFVSLTGASLLGTDLFVSDVIVGSFTTGTVDMVTGTYTVVSDQGGSTNWHGLATDDAAELLYTIDFNDNFTLKSMTVAGAVASIGTGTGIQGRGMAYDDLNDILYASDGRSLYTVSTATGTSTLIGAMGIDVAQLGLAYDEDAQTLYANAGGALDSLYTLDVATGAATLVGPNVLLGNIDGLAWVPDSAIIIPEPATLSLLGLGLLAVARRRRRR